jgi:nitrogen regulatory protein P-II 1
MKRIEAIIREDKLSIVVDALKTTGVGGITITQSCGVGAGERPIIGGARGTSKHVAPFNRLCTILVIVDDAKVSSVVSSIMDAAYTGKTGDGKIFITNVEEAFDIATKESGKNII